MNPNRKLWNEQHKRLRQALAKPEDHEAAIDLFLRQHAMVHDAEVSNTSIPSFSDEVWADVNEPVVRCLPSDMSIPSPGWSGTSPASKI